MSKPYIAWIPCMDGFVVMPTPNSAPALGRKVTNEYAMDCWQNGTHSFGDNAQRIVSQMVADQEGAD